MLPDFFIHGLIGGAGVAGIWLLSIMFDLMFPKSAIKEKDRLLAEKDKQIDDWKEAARLADQRAESERRRGDAAAEAANTSNILLAGIRKGIPSSAVEREAEEAAKQSTRGQSRTSRSPRGKSAGGRGAASNRGQTRGRGSDDRTASEEDS